MENPLALLPRQVRVVVYVVAFLVSLVLSIWQASEGNWQVFVAGLAAALVPLVAVSNVNPSE